MGLGRKPLVNTTPQRRNMDAMPYKAKRANLGLDSRVLVLTAHNEERSSPFSRIIAGEMPYSIGLTVVTFSIDIAVVLPCGVRSVGAIFISPE